MAYRLGNCDNFYFTIEYEYQMWVRIIESDQIPNCNFSNKSNLNSDKPKDFWIRPNINEYLQFWEKTKIKLFKNSH